MSTPHHSLPQSTPYSHQSTRLPLPLLVLPVSSQLMAVLLLQMFSPTVGKSKCSYELSEMSHFYDFWKKSGVQNRILLDTETQLLKLHTTGTVPGKPGRMIHIHTFPWTHQDDALLLTAIINRVMMEVWLMYRHFKTDKLLVFLNMTERQCISTGRWQYSWTGSSLSDSSTEG